MGACCCKKRKGDNAKRIKSGHQNARLSAVNLHLKEYPPPKNGSSQLWKVADVKTCMSKEDIDKIGSCVQFETPLSAATPHAGVSNVILFDQSTGTEIVKRSRLRPDLNKFPGGVQADFYRTSMSEEEKIAVVFKSANETTVEIGDVQSAVAEFICTSQAIMPGVIENGDPVVVAFDQSRPLKVKHVKRRRVIEKPPPRIDFKERFKKTFGKYFYPTPGHILVPESSAIEDLQICHDVIPGWTNVNGTYYYIILIELLAGQKYVSKLCGNPATSQLPDDTQGELFQCHYQGLQMVGLRLFHKKNLIQKVDRAARFLLAEGLKDVPYCKVFTDFDFRRDIFDITVICQRLGLNKKETEAALKNATF